MNLSLLKEIEQTGIGEETDFQFGGSIALPDGLTPEARGRLQFIARTKSGSLVCSWTAKDPAAPAVVWIDSEGTPTSLVARDLPGFLKLVPYGSGFIYAVVSALTNYAAYPALYPDHAEYLGGLEADAKRQMRTTSASRAYASLLAANGLDDTVEAAPVAAIRHAFESAPGLAAQLWQDMRTSPPK